MIEQWGWRIEPWTSRLGYWIYVVENREWLDAQGPPRRLGMQHGPNGGPHMAFGTQKRAIRKARRLAARQNRREAREVRLSMRSFS